MAEDIRDLLERLRARYLAARAAGAARFVAGVGGSVAVGKSTFARTLREAMADWPEQPRVLDLPTDGFLFPNRVLAERNLAMRKGFPESYDADALRIALAGIKDGRRVAVPRYSHVTYDVDPESHEIVDGTDIVVLDGLHLARVRDGETGRLIDQLIYLDADETHIERWFRDRLIPLMQKGRTDPNSFYYLFREMDDAGALAFTERVWREINLPNLRDHIVRDRDHADIVIRKGADHGVVAIDAR
jgi:type I pantothenate kinase